MYKQLQHPGHPVPHEADLKLISLQTAGSEPDVQSMACVCDTSSCCDPFSAERQGNGKEAVPRGGFIWR